MTDDPEEVEALAAIVTCGAVIHRLSPEVRLRVLVALGGLAGTDWLTKPLYAALSTEPGWPEIERRVRALAQAMWDNLERSAHAREGEDDE